MNVIDVCEGTVKLNLAEESSLPEGKKIMWIKSGWRVITRRTRLDALSGKTV